MNRRLTPTDLALWAALPMAHTSKIEGRIKMILDTTRRRTSPRRFLLLAAVTGAAALVPLSILRPAARATPLAPYKAVVLAEPEAMQWGRQYARENSLFMRGQNFSPQEAATQEKRLAIHPEDDTAHLSLLGYYWRRSIFNNHAVSAPAQADYQQQVFWLIQNRPKSTLFSMGPVGIFKRNAPAAFEKGKALWQEQAAKQPKSTVVLGNAANYCLLSGAAEEDASTEKLLKQAQALEPRSPVWPDKLGQLYRLNGPHPSAEVVRRSAKKALVEYELAATLADKTAQPNTSPDLAKTAFDAEEYEKARRYAEELLRRGQSPQQNGHDPNDDIHEANLVLGRLALHDGDLAGAEAHLLAMGRVSTSPVLGSFGPNMQLAKDLLGRGERAPVLDYFDECAKFWTFGQAKATLAAWTTEVKQGRIPDFHGNLDY